MKTAKYHNSISDAFLNGVVVSMLFEPSETQKKESTNCYLESRVRNTHLKSLKYRFDAMMKVYDLNEKLRSNQKFKDARKQINDIFEKLFVAEKSALDMAGTSS